MELSTRRPVDVLADVVCQAATVSLRALQALIDARWLLFLVMLSLMLFRPPGFDSFPFDRVAFLIVCVAVAIHLVTTHHPFQLLSPVTRPMAGLLVLSSCNVFCHGYNAESWSMFAAKWLVPFVIYQTAAVILPSQKTLRAFEIFGLIVLAYLTLTSVAFLVGANWAILPTYILDENLGIHADRARGPFLQAVANGVTLNFLGLIAIDTLRNRRLPKLLIIPLLAALPVAVLATKTRSVWLSFAGVLLLLLFSKSREIRRACLGLLIAALIGVVGFACWSENAIADRLEDRSPVEFRLSMYEAGLEMFGEKPLLGWGYDPMRHELGRRISDFHQEAFYFHNTYLEVLVEHGLLGLGLYLWMAFDLFRLGRKRLKLPWAGFPDQPFRSIWPLMLAVYFINATFVGMNYQFVNVLLFAIAGLLAAQNHIEDEPVHVP
jgi:O-antigen ligase